MKCFIFIFAVFALIRQMEMVPVNPIVSSKTNTTEENPRAPSPPEKDASEVVSNEMEPLPNSRNAIFRHRGITQAKKNSYWNYKPVERYPQYTGIQYSPVELAEYVFSTGDEEGVAVAVEELVREGMMGRTDAINYLQDVKQNLEYMRERFEEQKELEEEMRNEANRKLKFSEVLPGVPRELFMSEMNGQKRGHKDVEATAMPVVTTEHPHQEVIASTFEPKEQSISASTTACPETKSSVPKDKKMDRKKVSLNVFYVLKYYEEALRTLYDAAQEKITESIMKDDPDVVEPIFAELIDFLDTEVNNKNITTGVKRLILEVVYGALEESLQNLKKKPEFQLQNFDSSKFYQILNKAVSKHLNPEGSLEKELA